MMEFRVFSFENFDPKLTLDNMSHIGHLAGIKSPLPPFSKGGLKSPPLNKGGFRGIWSSRFKIYEYFS